MIGISDRQLRSWRERFDKEGLRWFAGLSSRCTRSKRVPKDQPKQVLNLSRGVMLRSER